jgi:phosphoglycerate dehydrogenase-like enzyme
MSDPDIVVLGTGVHGRPIEEYVAALRERLPDRDVRLAQTPTQQRELVASAPVVTGLEMDEDLLAAAESLELFACLYAGVGHLPLSAFEDRGVAVTSAAGVHGPNVAEYAIGQLLAFASDLHRGWQRQRRREWRHFQTRELQGATVTVVGLGAIGTAIVDRLEPFGVETVGVRYSPEKGGPTDEVVGFDGDGLYEAVARTDYLVLACPLTDTTEGLVDASVLDTLPPEAVLVNVARGPVVDTDDLVAALQRNRLRGAALDVTDPEPLPEDHPLWTLTNVSITPHNAGDTPEYYERVADILAENVRRRTEGTETELRNREV